jgi:hypothetical protein
MEGKNVMRIFQGNLAITAINRQFGNGLPNTAILRQVDYEKQSQEKQEQAFHLCSHPFGRPDLIFRACSLK